MDRIKKVFLFAACGLISLNTWAQDLPATEAGDITQVYGKITYLPFRSGAAVKEVQAKEKFRSHGSYLVHDESFLTAKFFDGSFLRASPRSKLGVDIDLKNKTILVDLYSGSLKMLFSQNLNEGKLQKLIIRSHGHTIETSEGKFSVVRSVNDQLNVYVEKGVVMASRPQGDFQYVHSNETVSLTDNGPLNGPKQMNEKERRFMHGNVYLRSIRKSL